MFGRKSLDDAKPLTYFFIPSFAMSVEKTTSFVWVRLIFLLFIASSFLAAEKVVGASIVTMSGPEDEDLLSPPPPSLPPPPPPSLLPPPPLPEPDGLAKTKVTRRGKLSPLSIPTAITKDCSSTSFPYEQPLRKRQIVMVVQDHF